MRLLLAVLAMLMLIGCSGVNTGQFSPVEKFTEENRAISESNRQASADMASAVVACGSNSTCIVAVTAFYMSGAGKQPLIKPETWRDYLGLLLPFADNWARLLYAGSGGGSGGQGIVVNRSDNVTFVGSGNKQEAESGGVLTANATPYMPSMNITQDTTSASGPISGTSPPTEPVIVQPEVVLVPAP